MRTAARSWLAVAAWLVFCAGSTACADAAPSPNSDFLAEIGVLQAPAGAGRLGFDDVAISGGLLAAHSRAITDNPTDLGPETGVWVFTRPANGWHSEDAAARLVPSSGALLHPIAISGETVFAGTAAFTGPGPGTNPVRQRRRCDLRLHRASWRLGGHDP
jgi:hypothetical protein